ncbi:MULTISPECIES: histone H1 [Sphingobacterium]|uniref:Histone H1 n=1 Tax=Sphingobacterium tenebrionis TaxID=3111775 RepID=A0ABU8I473_9SPHI|nr:MULTISPECIES: histone H1 [unclassified Sphingobacterium]QBR12057.1 histone H1 [Sphingobacterium sp. CZ-2]
MASIDKFKELKSVIDGLENDAEKFYSKANSAAGTRVRKGLQDVKTLAQSLRLGIQDLKNKK